MASEPVNGPWHIGPDGNAHYIRDGKPLCGAAGVDASCPKQHWESVAKGAFTHPVCFDCRALRAELRN